MHVNGFFFGHCSLTKLSEIASLKLTLFGLMPTRRLARVLEVQLHHPRGHQDLQVAHAWRTLTDWRQCWTLYRKILSNRTYRTCGRIRSTTLCNTTRSRKVSTDVSPHWAIMTAYLFRKVHSCPVCGGESSTWWKASFLKELTWGFITHERAFSIRWGSQH